MVVVTAVAAQSAVGQQAVYGQLADRAANQIRVALLTDRTLGELAALHAPLGALEFFVVHVPGLHADVLEQLYPLVEHAPLVEELAVEFYALVELERARRIQQAQVPLMPEHVVGGGGGGGAAQARIVAFNHLTATVRVAAAVVYGHVRAAVYCIVKANCFLIIGL